MSSAINYKSQSCKIKKEKYSNQNQIASLSTSSRRFFFPESANQFPIKSNDVESSATQTFLTSSIGNLILFPLIFMPFSCRCR